FQHGFMSSPQNSLAFIRPMAAAGFIVPGPHFPNINIGDISDGDLPADLSQILTNTIALNNAGTPFTGRINTTQVAVSGHSMGGMTVHAMLTRYPDSRIKAAIPMSCTDQGTPSSSISANVLFMHGDQDTTTSYSSGRQAYSEMPPPKAFLTWLGGGHNAMWSGEPIMARVGIEWMRWSLYGDTAARDRLASAASSPNTRWEFVPGTPPDGSIQAESGVTAGGTTIDNNNTGYNGSGFANFPTSGGTLTFNNVNGNGGGSKSLAIRYANGGTTARSGTITVNGATSSISFPPTGSWITWATINVPITLLNSSTNTIQFASTGQDLGNIDQITVPNTPPPPVVYQAESAAVGGGTTIDSNNTGYVGSGFANFSITGGTLTFSNVNGNGGGTKSLAIRYALGATGARTGTITVNGATANITFNPTGSWTTWATMNVNITLGDNSTNTIQFASTGQDLGNIDQITVP
ncbi:MAG TPA: carbohydrate-binding protein, partial [Candidatus Synoicihabitans sp.]|nr:carbohydrate-binding protein [Candidatus Synoicihabitans sp.]